MCLPRRSFAFGSPPDSFNHDQLEFSPNSLGPSSTAEAHLEVPRKVPSDGLLCTYQDAQASRDQKKLKMRVKPSSLSWSYASLNQRHQDRKHCSLKLTISAAGNLEETCSSTSSSPLGITVVLVAGGCAVQILGDIRGEANCRDTRSNEISLVIVVRRGWKGNGARSTFGTVLLVVGTQALTLYKHQFYNIVPDLLINVKP
ncbi:hypothetical protein C8J56DRAFT_1068122 [Mycena floridula]|nr:hypothetical protein C8J56DRAFT_1068122 [Mycena floridula]